MFEILKAALLIAGILHLIPLAAGLTMPRVLRWGTDLGKLDALTRQLIWVHGAFIVVTIVAFGLLTVTATGKTNGHACVWSSQPVIALALPRSAPIEDQVCIRNPYLRTEQFVRHRRVVPHCVLILLYPNKVLSGDHRSI